MEKIHAWIYDPTRSLFGDKKGRAAVFELFCPDKNACDVYTKCGSCISTGSLPCKLGRKSKKTGFTPRARNFYTWIADRKEENKDFLSSLKSLQAYNRIFKVIDHWYLPYAHMTPIFGDPAPIQSKWVHQDDMNAQTLNELCDRRPRSLMGGEIKSYQDEVVPKFIADLSLHYPELFDLLAIEHKARVETVDYVGRTVDITTCEPGRYKFTHGEWEWDGEKLTGSGMTFPPCKGRQVIHVYPEKGEPAKLTSNDQVTPNVVFLD